MFRSKKKTGSDHRNLMQANGLATPARWHLIQSTKLLPRQTVSLVSWRMLTPRVPAETPKISGWRVISETIASLIKPIPIATRLYLARVSHNWAIVMTWIVCNPFLPTFQCNFKPRGLLCCVTSLTAGLTRLVNACVSWVSEPMVPLCRLTFEVLLLVAIRELGYFLGWFDFVWNFSRYVSRYCDNGRCLLLSYHHRAAPKYQPNHQQRTLQTHNNNCTTV